jgi:adenosylcobinamide kinase/adenosylcobinamide-phosphate guanylyltransferase
VAGGTAGLMADPFVFLLGGTRSGKSGRALARTRELAGDGRAWVLATAIPGDPELDRRIARHRRERPASWPTLDVGTDLARALDGTDQDEPVLVEGLTLWLSALAGDEPVDPDPILDGPLADALAVIERRSGPVVIVSDELGIGLAPMHAGARSFRDLAGLVHQRVAAAADEVELIVAGLPLRLKP